MRVPVAYVAQIRRPKLFVQVDAGALPLLKPA